MQPDHLAIDPSVHPFARAGSWTSLVAERSDGAPVLHLLDLNGRRMWDNNRLFRIDAARDGAALVGMISCSPACLRVSGADWSLEAAYDGPDVLRLRATGCTIRITRVGPRDGSALTIPIGERVLRLQQGGFPHYAVTALQGDLSWTGSRILINTFGHGKQPDLVQIAEVAPRDGVAELALENHLNHWRQREYPRTFAACVADALADFARWCDASPATPDAWAEARLLAAYTCWSTLVEPRGFLRRRVMVSSKNRMHSLWSWDSHFFALTYAATVVVALAAHQADRPDLLRAPKRVLAHLWAGGL